MPSEFFAASEITRGRVVAVDDAPRGQLLTVVGYRGERFTAVERAQPHGYSSHPPVGSIGHFLRLGSSDRVFALGFETEGRPRSLPAGGAALYNADGTVWKLLQQKADLDHGGKNHHARAVGKYRIEASDWVHVDAGAVYLGKPPYFPVMTAAGPSQHVFAGIGPAAPDTPQGSIG